MPIGDVDLAQVAIAAIVGGTASEISGGKFANGAVTAAILNIYNQQGRHRGAHYRDKSNTLAMNDPLYWDVLGERILAGDVLVDSGGYALGFVDGQSMNFSKVIRAELGIDLSDLEMVPGYNIGDNVSKVSGLAGLVKGSFKAFIKYRRGVSA